MERRNWIFVLGVLVGFGLSMAIGATRQPMIQPGDYNIDLSIDGGNVQLPVNLVIDHRGMAFK